MTVANDVFRRISRQLRTMRIALTVSEDECVLMDHVRVRRREDGTLESLSKPEWEDTLWIDRNEADGKERWDLFPPTVDGSWILDQIEKRAKRIWVTMVTPEEQEAIRKEANEDPRNILEHQDIGTHQFIGRLMRRVLGYQQTPDKAAALCSLAVCRMLDPRMTLAIRQICGWKIEGSEHVIRAWDRVDAAGRQIGLSGRPVQVSCLSLLMARHIERQTEGFVGILDADPRTAQRRFDEFEDYVRDPNVDEYVPSMPSSQVDDLCEIADHLPSALRGAGVKPAFWRMALRMSPAQIRALKCLLSRQWSPAITELLNALSAIDPTLLRPTLLRTLSQRWIDSGWEAPQRAIVLAVLHRAAVGIASRRSRQPLRDAVHHIEQVVDHISHLALTKAREDREALGLTWDEPAKFDLDDLDGPFRHWQPETEATLRRKSDDSIAALRRVLPNTRDWKQLVAASDVWHAESILAMDESDSRTWPRLLVDPVAIGDVTVTELDSAALLRQETRELNHCVGTGGYADQCMSGSTRILSFRLKGLRSRSTMQLALKDGAWRNVQHRGRANSVPKPALLAAEKTALKAVNAAQKRAAEKAANDDAMVAQAA